MNKGEDKKLIPGCEKICLQFDSCWTWISVKTTVDSGMHASILVSFPSHSFFRFSSKIVASFWQFRKNTRSQLFSSFWEQIQSSSNFHTGSLGWLCYHLQEVTRVNVSQQIVLQHEGQFRTISRIGINEIINKMSHVIIHHRANFEIKDTWMASRPPDLYAS